MAVKPRPRARLGGIAPWAGLIAAGIAWGLHQQIVAEALHFDCGSTADGTGIALGLVALTLVIGGALASWKSVPHGKAKAPPATAMRGFIAHLSLMASGLAALGIGLHVLAAVILPGCRP